MKEITRGFDKPPTSSIAFFSQRFNRAERIKVPREEVQALGIYDLKRLKMKGKLRL